MLSTSKLEVNRHVELLTGEPDTEVYVRFLDDTKTDRPAAERHGTIEMLWPEIEAFQRDRYGVFLIPNATGAAGAFVTDKDIKTIRASFTDADGAPEPTDWHVPPAFLVRTSPGKWHAYWAVRDVAVADFEELQRRLAAQYKTDPVVCNPSRVMRLAGTFHWKDPEHPHLVTIEDRTGGADRWEIERSFAEMSAGLPSVEAKKTAAHSTPRTDVDWDEPHNIDRGRAYLAKEVIAGRVAIETVNGNATLHRIAAQLRDFLVSEAEAKRLVWENFNPHCRPSWVDPADPAFTGPIESAYRGNVQNSAPGRDAISADIPEGWKQYADAPENLAMNDNTSSAAGAEPKDDGGPRSITGEDENEDFADAPVCAADYQTAEFPPVKELAPGWIEQDIVTYLEGPGGTHKSRIALQDALCLAAGKKIFGEPVAQTGCLYLNYENPRDEMKRRVQAMAKLLGWPGRKDAPLDIDLSDLHIWELRDKPRAILTVKRNGEIMITRFGRRVVTYLTSRREKGLHTFVVFDGLMDAIIFEGSTRSEDAVAIRIIKLLDRWCVEYGFTAYAIIHPSRAAERLGISGGSYATAWSTKPRAIQSMTKVVTKGEGWRTDPLYKRQIIKRSHGAAGVAMVVELRDGLLHAVTAKGNALAAPAAADVILRWTYGPDNPDDGRLRRDGKIGAGRGPRKLMADDWIMDEFHKLTGNDRLQPADLIRAADSAVVIGLLGYQEVPPGSNASRKGIRAGYCKPAALDASQPPEGYDEDPIEDTLAAE